MPTFIARQRGSNVSRMIQALNAPRRPRCPRIQNQYPLLRAETDGNTPFDYAAAVRDSTCTNTTSGKPWPYICTERST